MQNGRGISKLLKRFDATLRDTAFFALLFIENQRVISYNVNKIAMSYLKKKMQLPFNFICFNLFTFHKRKRMFCQESLAGRVLF